MKIAVYSDLHVEFGQPWEPPEDLDFDVLVLAGDLDSEFAGLDMAHRISMKRQCDVVVIAGNHEFYGYDYKRTLKNMDIRYRRHHMTHFLERATATIGGVRFIGATLWTDFCLFGADHKAEAMRAAKECMSDFHLIRWAGEGPGLSVPISPADTARIHARTLEWTERTLAQPHDGPTVVVTHHLPSMRSVAERYREDLVTAAFASHLDEIIERYQPELWLHGHTHDACDYFIGKTRVLCNPRGYPSEADSIHYGFSPNLVVEI